MAQPFLRISSASNSPLAKAITGRGVTTGPIKRALNETLNEIWIQGIKVFVETLARDVAVETGESLGSLVPLAARVDASLAQPSMISSSRKRRQLDGVTGVPIPGTKRSFQSGVSRGENSFSITMSKNNYKFSYLIPVFQFALHDSGRANNQNPRALDATQRAVAAQLEFVNKAYRKRVGKVMQVWLASGIAKTVVT